MRSEHGALNVLLQSCAAILAKQWVHLIDQEIKRQDIPATIVAFVHDEIQISVKQQQKEGVADHVGTLTRRMAEEADELSISVSLSSRIQHRTNMGRHSLMRKQTHIAAVYAVVNQAKIKPYTTKSDFARTWATHVALAACEGLITTRLTILNSPILGWSHLLVSNGLDEVEDVLRD